MTATNTSATAFTETFTDRHERQLQAIREYRETAGPKPGESVSAWVQRRFCEVMADHLVERESEA